MPTSVDTNVEVLPSGLAVSTGVALAEAVAPASPAYGAVEWLDVGNGSYLASRIFGQKQSNSWHQGWWQVNTPNYPSGYAGIKLEAGNSNQSPRHGVYAQAADEVNGFTRARKILDSVGGSDFMMLSRVKATTQAGPWNSNPFNFTLDGGDTTKAYIVYGASAWCTASGGASTLDMYLDGNLVSQISFWFNVANQHLFLGVGIYDATLAAGGHTVALKNGTPLGFPLSSDGQDRGFFLVIPHA